ncbi:hypothetical protein ONZ45_g1412 [Pleurotus djamor]|nr:hypothetical protein ONZ45_g1412 [Pleurotus djamor]
MERLTTDPHTLTCPDYTLELYARVRQSVTDAGINEEQAVERLKALWNAQNEVQRELWNQQVEADRLAEVASREQQEAEEVARAQAEAEEVASARAEDRKKNKVKYAPVPQRPVPNTPVILPSPYALHKLDRGLWVELWYFTNAGLAATTADPSSAEDDAMAVIQRSDGSHGLVAAPSTKASKLAVSDKCLTWENFTQAAARFVEAIRLAAWPQDRVDMFIHFFTALQSHPFRFTSNAIDQQALLTYEDEQRRLWHNTISNSDSAYSIAQINEELLRATRDRVYQEDQTRRDRDREYVSHLPVSYG